MNFTHPYWTPDASFRTQKFLKPISNNIGFTFQLPWPAPVTAGYYYGEGGENIFGRRTQVTDSRPEYFTVGGDVMPTTGGIPAFDPHGKVMTFSRKKYTKRI